jgi:hypothetical protein
VPFIQVSVCGKESKFLIPFVPFVTLKVKMWSTCCGSVLHGINKGLNCLVNPLKISLLSYQHARVNAVLF